MWLHGRRALSPIFATMLLAAIILTFGSVAYYYASNATTTATNNYVGTLSSSQQTIAERISFENVVYIQSTKTLTIYIINSGSESGVIINSVILYDANHNIVGVFGPPTFAAILRTIDGGATIPGSSLNVGKEAYFTVLVAGSPLTPGSIYSFQLSTKRGSFFDYEFTA